MPLPEQGKGPIKSMAPEETDILEAVIPLTVMAGRSSLSETKTMVKERIFGIMI